MCSPLPSLSPLPPPSRTEGGTTSTVGGTHSPLNMFSAGSYKRMVNDNIPVAASEKRESALPNSIGYQDILHCLVL